MIFEQAFVDISEMAHVEVTVGDAFALLCPCQEFDNLCQCIVANPIIFKERVLLRIEKPTVVLRDVVFPAVIDERK